MPLRSSCGPPTLELNYTAAPDAGGPARRGRRGGGD